MLYVTMLIACLLGGFLHILIKIRAISKRNSNETFRTVWQAYWKEDWISILVTLTVSVVAVFVSKEWLHLTPNVNEAPKSITELITYKLADFIRTVFVGIGYCADSAVYAILGTAEKKLWDKARAGGVEV